MPSPWTDGDEFLFEAELPWRGVLLDMPVTGICRIDQSDGTILDIWLVTLTPGKSKPYGRYLLSEADGGLLIAVQAILADYQDVIEDMVGEFHASMAANHADLENDRRATAY